jgi:uncharacterized membrane protein (UPF0136 family)
MSSPALRGFYRHLLNLYPPDFRVEYGEEIQMVFELSLASKQGWAAWRLVFRELASAPHVLLSLHWREWKLRGWRSVFLDSHSPVRDGRHSWALAWAEASFFIVWAGLMVLLTYGDSTRVSPGWYRDLNILGILGVILPLPILLLGLGRALPRWVYPFYGLLLAYLCYAGLRYHLELILAATILAIFALATMAARANVRHPLPDFLQNLGRSLRLDPLRWSFAVYGAAPLLLLWAYDDGYANNRSFYLLLSTIGLLLGAISYIRLKAPSSRLAALVAGLALALLPAILDQAAHTGVIYSGEAAPILWAWTLVTALILGLPLMPGACSFYIQVLKKE